MIEAYLLTERFDEEEEKVAELCGKEYKGETEYTLSFVNLQHVMRVIPQKEKDIYLLSFVDEDVLCKITPEEVAKISKK